MGWKGEQREAGSVGVAEECMGGLGRRGVVGAVVEGLEFFRREIGVMKNYQGHVSSEGRGDRGWAIFPGGGNIFGSGVGMYRYCLHGRGECKRRADKRASSGHLRKYV